MFDITCADMLKSSGYNGRECQAFISVFER